MNCIDLIRSTDLDGVLPPNTIRLSDGPLMSEAATFWAGVTLAHERGGIVVTTAPPCWSYAVQIPFSAQPPERRFRLRVKARVEEGEIGIGIVTNAPERFLVELRFDHQTGAEQVSEEIESLEDVKAVIVRNACRDNRPSRAFIEEIGLYYD